METYLLISAIILLLKGLVKVALLMRRNNGYVWFLIIDAVLASIYLGFAIMGLTYWRVL